MPFILTVENEAVVPGGGGSGGGGQSETGVEWRL